MKRFQRMDATGLVRPPTWHGTPAGWQHLMAALINNCAERTQLDRDARATDRCYACPSCLIAMDQVELDRFAFLPAQAFVAAEYAERN